MITGVEGPAGGGASRRFRLREQTAAAHAAVEDIVARSDSFGSRFRYLAWLEASHAIRSGFEHALDAGGAAEVWPLWPTRRIAPLILADISDLGGHEPARIPVPTPVGEAEMLGMLYVLEGSSLGARVLVGSAAKLGFDAGLGARHLHHQAGDRVAWRDFTARLDAEPMSPAAERACLAAALATFEAFADAYLARV